MSDPETTPQTGTGRRIREIAGRRIILDEEGFFNDFDDWSEQVFGVLAREAGIMEITEDHLRVIRFFREFYDYNRRAPLNNQLRKGAGLKLLEIESLFPGGIKNGARRLAGLPNPKSCT